MGVILKIFVWAFLALIGIATLLLFDINMTAIIITAIIAFTAITVVKTLRR